MKTDLLKNLLEQQKTDGKNITIYLQGQEICIAPNTWDFYDKNTIIINSNKQVWFVDINSITATISY